MNEIIAEYELVNRGLPLSMSEDEIEMRRQASEALEELEKKYRLNIIRQFVAKVNELAERNIERTGQLEGSHYAAMTKLLKDMETEVE